jgi:hypothetical protein
MDLPMPAVLREFMFYNLQLVNYDILPTDEIYEFLLGPDDTTALSENFNFAGYSSS